MKDAVVKFLGYMLYRYRHFIQNILNRKAYLIFTHECSNHQNLFVEYPVVIDGGQYMKIGNNFFAFSNLRLECIDKWNDACFNPQLEIGKNVALHYRCHIGCINKIIIGNNVLVGSNVLITDHSHGMLSEVSKSVPWYKRSLISNGPVIIKDNVWIGENVSILPNVTIGEGSVIGANSVVCHDIPSYSMAAGNPARVIKQL